MYAILKEGIMCSYMKFGPVVPEELSFKNISYLELWQPLCSLDWNHLCNIGIRHHEEQSCKIILNLDLWFRRKCSSRYFLSGALAAFYSSEYTICAILVESINRNNSAKLF